jgi:hypothetical protein
MVHVFIRHKVKDYGSGDKYSTGLPRSVEQEAKWHLGSPPFPGSRTIFAFSSSGRVSLRHSRAAPSVSRPFIACSEPPVQETPELSERWSVQRTSRIPTSIISRTTFRAVVGLICRTKRAILAVRYVSLHRNAAASAQDRTSPGPVDVRQQRP